MTSAEELRRSLEHRANGLLETARHLRGALGASRSDLDEGLALFERFSQDVVTASDSEWVRTAASPGAQISALTPLLKRITTASKLLDRHFSHGERRELPESLAREIRAVLSELGLERYRVVTSHGDADNFVTSYGSLEDTLFSPITGVLGPRPFLSGRPYALFQVPRIEGAGLYWKPWLLGHEVAHIAVDAYDAVSAFDLAGKFDYAMASNLASPGVPDTATPVQKRTALYNIARDWLTELICDAFAVRQYGPAGVAAIAEFSTTVGANSHLGKTHPPGLVRLKLAIEHLGPVTEPRLDLVVQPWKSLVLAALPFPEQWCQFLIGFFETNSASIMDATSAWPASRYQWASRQNIITHVADRLVAGQPGDQLVRLNDGVVCATDADHVNAAWIAHAEGADAPIDRLGRKGLDSLEFCRRWVEKGGEPPILLGDDPFDPEAVGSERGLLSERSLRRRMHPHCADRLVVTPLLQRPKGAGVDLRLGNRFIVFKRTAIGSFDPIQEDSDPRILQTYVELDWKEQFVLHPNEMVLGATLEYLVLPKDLSAQVLSRSSYGRLGLLAATATQVHPYFHGCLTLELVNLSSIPLVLSPGERVAQLIVSVTEEVDDPGQDKYVFATGPEFSKVRDDDEAGVLRSFRTQ